MNFYLEFEKYRDGQLVSKHSEPAHSWTSLGWAKMLKYFMLLDEGSITGFSGEAGNHSKGILIGSSDKAFDFNEISLDSQLIIPATETEEHDYALQYLDTVVQPVEYDVSTKKWTTRIKRGFYVISSHLGGANVIVKEIGLAEVDSLVWARDVLSAPITIEPLDTLYITYIIHTDMSEID